MKAQAVNLLLSITFCLLVLPARAQIQTGPNVNPRYADEISKEDLEHLKKTTTLFVLQQKDYAQKEIFERAIAAAWKITPFKIVSVEEASKSNKVQHSYFSIEATVSKSMMNGAVLNYSFAYPRYELNIYERNKKGSFETKTLSKIFIGYDYGNPACPSGDKTSVPLKDYANQMYRFIYNDATIYNWGAGFLGVYLKIINNAIETRKKVSVFDVVKCQNALRAFKKIHSIFRKIW